MPVAKPTGTPGGTPGPQSQVRPRVLVVDDEPALVELVSDVVRSMDCRIVTAGSIAEAKKLLAAQDVELLVTDVHLPDGDGTTLLPALRRRHPTASAIVITGSPSVDTAVTALRHGAVDFIPKPFNNDQLVAHVRKALQLQARAAKDERKVERLRVAVRRLNEARRMISKKVDILCNDLISAYGELSRQLEGVRTVEGFRKAIDTAVDLEQLLCHTMDWLLRQLGYSNVAVWLAGEDGDYQLGAYMKYTVAGEPTLTAALKREVLPLAARDNRDAVVRAKAADLRDRLTPEEFAPLKGHELLAMNCTYLGESLAALIFFRDGETPFRPEDEALLRSLGPVLALSLANIVRDTGGPAGGAGGDDGAEGDGDDDGSDFPDDRDAGTSREARDGRDDDEDGRGDGGPRRRKNPKRDAADWWKRGEPPPF